MGCNICGSKENKPYLNKFGLTIVRCQNCGLLYTYPQPSKNIIAKLYNQDYFQSSNPLELGYLDYFGEQKNLEKEAEYYLNIINKYLTLKNANLYEVGCAFGFFLNRAKKRGAKVSGVEISKYAAEIARNKFKLDVTTESFLKISSSKKFDAIVMFTTLEHLSDPLVYLAKASKLLKPKGLLFISVPNASNFFAKITNKNWPGFQKIKEHNYFFTQKSISNLLNKSHFTIVNRSRAPFYCSLSFIAKKLAAYNRLISNLLLYIINKFGLPNYSLNFGVMDMLIIAQKNDK